MKINTLLIVLFLISFSFFSCRTNEKEDDVWTEEDKELLLNTCIDNSTKDSTSAVTECDCFVKEVSLKTKNSNEFEKLTFEEVAQLREKCEINPE